MKAIKFLLVFLATFMISSVSLAAYDIKKEASFQVDSIMDHDSVVVDSIALYDFYGDILKVNTLQRVDYLKYSCGEFKGSDKLLDSCYKARINKKWVHCIETY